MEPMATPKPQPSERFTIGGRVVTTLTLKKPQPSERFTIGGRVVSVRRHGKRLNFVRIKGGRAAASVTEHQLVFETGVFDHAGSRGPFPQKKRDVRVGDRVEACVSPRLPPPRACPAEGTRPGGDHHPGNEKKRTPGRTQLYVLRWQRWPRETDAAAASAAPAGRGRSKHGRRQGRAAEAGWVKCPLCPPSSHRRYGRAGGLHAHLDAIHDAPREEDARSTWHAAQAARADGLGIVAARGGGGAGRKKNCGAAPGSRDERATYGHRLSHPGLIAARDGDAAELLRLLSNGFLPFDAGSLDMHGASALDWAAGGGHLACVDILAPHAIGIAVCRRDGRGPAHWAARHGHTAVLERLLTLGVRGCELEIRTADGTSMLMLACYGGHVATAQALVARGANLRATNGWGCDAGHFAALGGSVAACAWLRDAGLALDRPQNAGHTALHKAAELGRADAVHFLVLGGGLPASALDRLRRAPVSDNPGKVTGDGLLQQENAAHRRWKAHLPSRLARKAGHNECADFLDKAGL